ncbi:MYB DNA-binding domain protein [Blumeria hordei DH14]|uniref:MYB DNA-binding domain protein n=1 Tax=Blumeria graminis f. sp. hordei (strain DH14) TaxID=546991 RepID=N1JIA7_BLUG1|nr:MYB DNA-binding domain protein [Blumeria hordei DH14]
MARYPTRLPRDETEILTIKKPVISGRITRSQSVNIEDKSFPPTKKQKKRLVKPRMKTCLGTAMVASDEESRAGSTHLSDTSLTGLKKNCQDRSNKDVVFEQKLAYSYPIEAEIICDSTCDRKSSIEHSNSEQNLDLQNQYVEIDAGNMIDYLNLLMLETYRMLELIAPKVFLEQDYYDLIRDLQISDSLRAKQFKLYKQRFDHNLQVYLTDSHAGPQYMEIKQVVRALLESEEAIESSCRPDAIFYASNIVILLKEILIINRGDDSSNNLTRKLFSYFPRPFINDFQVDFKYGNSALENETFDLGLEIKTQNFLTDLKSQHVDLHLNDILEKLKEHFFFQPLDYSPRFQDFIEKGSLKSILCGRPNSIQEAEKIKSRLCLIYSHLNCKEVTIELTNYVDLECLEKKFPWDRFLIMLVQWSRLRTNELLISIQRQGGIDNITSQLSEKIQSQYSPLPEFLQSKRLAVGGIVSITHELYDGSLLSKKNIRRLRGMKRMSNSNFIEQNQKPNDELLTLSDPDNRLRTEDPELLRTGDSSIESSENLFCEETVTKNEVVSEVEVKVEDIDNVHVDELAGLNGEEENFSPKNDPSNTYVLQQYCNDRTKNRSVDIAKNSPNKEQHHPTTSEPTIKKILPEICQLSDSQRKERGSSAESIETAFEEDKRDHNLGARPQKRLNHPEISAQSNLLPTKRIQISDERANCNSLESSEYEDEIESPKATPINTVARGTTARPRTTSSGVQIRTPWSYDDEQLLREGIETYGCRWSYLSTILEGWDRRRDQVALKDKARNMKVSYVKSGVPLPANFDKVRLGKKEVASIRNVIPDYDPET